MEQERLDILLINRGIFSSRERAKEHIKKGEIKVDGKVAKKSGQKVTVDCEIEFTGQHLAYVSRGGLKLEKAIKDFSISLKGKVCMDIGASTGGFTDCMLQEGAVKVFSVDVGTNQLHEKLREDERVVSLEQCNIRELEPMDIGERVSFISMDVSFISLHKVMECAGRFLKSEGEICVLIKPQFECERKHLNKKGVIKNKKEHVRIIKDIIQEMYRCNIGDLKMTYSPIKGPNGNTEYVMLGSKDKMIYNELDVEQIVDEALDK